MSKNLFADDSDDENGGNTENNTGTFQLRTNENYAKHYNEQCKRQLIQKFKDKKIAGGANGFSDDELSESSSSSSSDEDEEIDAAFDQEFLKAMACLKRKDPTMYDKSTKFFNDESTSSNDDEDADDSDDNHNEEVSSVAVRKGANKKKDKPITIKDYEREVILKKEGKFEDDSDEDGESSRKMHRSASPCIAEQERELKAEFKQIIDQKDDESDEEFGGIFKPRVKNEAEISKENADYLQWLAGKQECLDSNSKETLAPLKDYWNSDNLKPSEKFLRDFILNNGYVEAKSYDEIPTYNEIVGEDANLSNDEKDLEEQEVFEHKYNYRFEEEDPDFIKRYPRTITNSVRRTDDKRKQKRKETKIRKQQEKKEKMRELEIIKEAKRKEILDKIEKLKLVTGNEDLNINENELDEDFDPEAHDKRMAELFNNDYYQVEEGEEKPQCPSDIEELQVENWDNCDPYENDDLNTANEPHCEDEDFNMDCDYDPAQAKKDLQEELIGNSRRARGRNRKRNRFMEMLKADKPFFDPNGDKTYSEYVDEYYKLNYEDVIAGTPCRFKYVETTPNDFGLTVEEILLAKNKELNQWASLKKAVQIRPDRVEKKEQKIYQLKANNMDLKKKILKSLYGEPSDDEDGEKEKKVQQDQHVSDAKKDETVAEEPKNETGDNGNGESTESTTQKRKRKRKKKTQSKAVNNGSESHENVSNKKVKLNNSDEQSDHTTNEQSNYKNFKEENQTSETLTLETKKNETAAEESKQERRDNEHSDTVVLPTQKQTRKTKKTVVNDGAESHENVNNKRVKLNTSEEHASGQKRKHNKSKREIDTTETSVAIGQVHKKMGNGPKSKTPFKNAMSQSMVPKNATKPNFSVNLDANRQISDERLRAYGSSMYKYHKKQKYMNKNQQKDNHKQNKKTKK